MLNSLYDHFKKKAILVYGQNGVNYKINRYISIM